MSTATDPSLREVTQIKREIARSLRSRLKSKGVSVSSLARDTGTSRTAIRRVLDPVNTSITLHTLVRTAHSLGYSLRLSMEPRIEKVEPVPAPDEAQPLMADLARALDRLPRRR